MILQGHGSRRCNVAHVIKRRQKNPGHVLGGVVVAGDDGPRPDRLLDFPATLQFLLGSFHVRELLIDFEPLVQVLPKQTAHFGLVSGRKQVQP